jgi:hypothetical protein
MNVFAFVGATPVLAPAVAAGFIGGTPGADNTAAGLVTGAALGIAALVDAAGAALVVADVPGAPDVPGGGEAVETDAVIE